MGKIRYAYLDDAPVIFDDDRAFEFVGGKWKPLNVDDAKYKARLLSKAEFNVYAAISGDVEPLPL